MKNRIILSLILIILTIGVLASLSACYTDGKTNAKNTNSTAPVLNKVSISAASSGQVSADATDFSYSIIDDTTCAITKYTGSATELSIPEVLDGYTVVQISSSAFSGCTSLSSIKLPSSVTAIRSSSFSGCTSLYDIEFGEALTNIDNNAFENCKALASLDLPDSLDYIGNSAFKGCTSLFSVTLPDSITRLAGDIFSGCTNITSINLPKNISEAYTDYYGHSPFSSAAIAEVIIPAGIEKIPNNMFANVASLTTVVIPEGVTEIGTSAFSSCTALESVTLPESLTVIGERAFYSCSALESITLPDSLTTLGSTAFADCKSLTSVTLSDGLTEIPYYTFSGCTSLSSINLPSSVTAIRSSSFSGCTSLYDIEFGEALTSIENNAFENCKALASLDLPDSLDYIGSSAFKGCTSLSSVTLPDSITRLGSDIFSGCTNITSINLPKNISEAYTDYYGHSPFSSAAIAEVIIPAGIEKIPNNMFANVASLTTVVIPEGVTEIGTSVFSGCTALESVTLPESLTVIGDYAFRSCTSLLSIRIPISVTTCSKYVFPECPDITVFCYSNSAAHNALFGTECKIVLIDDHQHEYVMLEMKDATCTAGAYKKSICQICEFILIERGEPLGHEFSNELIPPTCINAGYTLHSCSRCDYSYSSDYTQRGTHSYGEWVVEKEASIFADGLLTSSCIHCNDKQEKVIEKLVVDVENDENYGLAKFRVVHSQTLDPLAGAQIFVSTDAGEYTFLTDENGRADIVLPVGRVNLSFIAKDCLIRNLELDIAHGINVFPDVGLSELSGYDVRISSEIMTLDEIIAAGIDVSDPANQHVVRYRLEIKFKSEIDYASLLAFFNKEGICLDIIKVPEVDIDVPDTPITPGEPIYTLHYHVVTGGLAHRWCEIVEVRKGDTVTLDFTPERDNDDYVFDGWYKDASLTQKISSVYIENLETNVYGKWIYVGEGEEPKFGFGSAGITFPLGDETLTVYPASENFYLIVRGEVKWLKEMFDVEMLIVNNSMTDTLEDLSATLKLPDGLSLPLLFGEEQPAVKYVGDIEEGGSRSVHWYVRGDKAGNYSLEANLKGKVMPFGEEIDDIFVSADNLRVYAGNALHLNFSFPSVTYTGEDYPMIITLTNVSDITLYNVHNLIRVREGMVVFYSDGTKKEEWKTTNYRHSDVKEFKPGDQLIIELSIDTFFDSEVIGARIEKYVKNITEVEKMYNMCVAGKAAEDRLSFLFNSVTGCISAVESYSKALGSSDPKAKLILELLTNLDDLELALVGSNDAVSHAADNSVCSAILTIISAVGADPEGWLKDSSEDEVHNLADAIGALTNSLNKKEEETYKFNVFDSLRTAVSAIPIRFAIESVVMIPDSGNTTVIPWSYTATVTDVRYFGVSNVSSYVLSLAKTLAGTYFEGVASIDLDKLGFLDETINMVDSIEDIRATEKELEAFKVNDSTGNMSFKAWVEDGNGGAKPISTLENENAYTLTCDSESAVYENGVLTFKGAAWVYLTPNVASDCTLYIECGDGTLYTYRIDVVEEHECAAGERETVISPTSDSDGYAVEYCTVCYEILDIIVLSKDAVCTEHSYGEWKEDTAAECKRGGFRTHTCAVCGSKEYEVTPATGHAITSSTVTPPTCQSEGYTTYSCSCGENTYVSDNTPKTSHVYNDEGICETCGTSADQSGTDCDCGCHKTGFAKFWFNFILFFARLFGLNEVCPCGVKHY